MINDFCSTFFCMHNHFSKKCIFRLTIFFRIFILIFRRSLEFVDLWAGRRWIENVNVYFQFFILFFVIILLGKMTFWRIAFVYWQYIEGLLNIRTFTCEFFIRCKFNFFSSNVEKIFLRIFCNWGDRTKTDVALGFKGFKRITRTIKRLKQSAWNLTMHLKFISLKQARSSNF